MKWFEATHPTAKNATAALWRNLLSNLGVTEEVFSELLDRFITVAAKESNAQEKASFRGNLYKALMREQLTWQIFQQGLMVLDLKSMTMHLVNTDENLLGFVETSHISLGMGTAYEVRKEKGLKNSDDVSALVFMPLERVFSAILQASQIAREDFKERFMRYAVRQHNLYGGKGPGYHMTILNAALRTALTFQSLFKILPALGSKKLEIKLEVVTRRGSKTTASVRVIFK